MRKAAVFTLSIVLLSISSPGCAVRVGSLHAVLGAGEITKTKTQGGEISPGLAGLLAEFGSLASGFFGRPAPQAIEVKVIGAAPVPTSEE